MEREGEYLYDANPKQTDNQTQLKVNLMMESTQTHKINMECKKYRHFRMA